MLSNTQIIQWYKKQHQLLKVETVDETRVETGMEELNRVLGGGIVPGSLVLIGGDPGIGKSTLLMQVSALVIAKRTSCFVHIWGRVDATNKASCRATWCNI